MVQVGYTTATGLVAKPLSVQMTLDPRGVYSMLGVKGNAIIRRGSARSDSTCVNRNIGKETTIDD
jgi:hypothetical protein